LTTPERPIACLILAAGKGTRMKSGAAKVLAHLAGKPLLAHVLDSIGSLPLARSVVIVGHDRETVQNVFAHRGLEFVVQEEQLGTGHAVQVAEPTLAGFSGDLLILSGDMPLVRPETLTGLLAHHEENAAELTLLSARPEDPYGLGRVVRDEADRVDEIVEECDIRSDAIRAIREVNLGVYAARNETLFAALREVERDNAQGEYYLPDVVKVLRESGNRVEAWCGAAPEEGLGVNRPSELARASAVFRQRAVEGLMAEGVQILDPASTCVEADVAIGPGTVIHPFSLIRRGARVGANCEIGPFGLVAEGQHLPDGAKVESAR